jgi:DNA-directed RNA polymerase sigma subunit (sigma70/sigma32)
MAEDFDPAAPQSENRVERDEEAARVRRALKTLPPERQELLARRFGLDGGEPATLEALAAGRTKEAARKWVEKSLRHLGDLLAE